MKSHKKADFPVDKIRRFLEPGPIVLVSSAHKGEWNIMAMGWHMVLGYDHIGCYIWDQNHSRELIHKSKGCVFNVPTFDLIEAVIGAGCYSVTGPRCPDPIRPRTKPRTRSPKHRRRGSGSR